MIQGKESPKQTAAVETKPAAAGVPAPLLGSDRPKFDVEEPCLGIMPNEQPGVEIVTTSGLLYIAPYANFVVGRHESIDKAERLVIMIGALKFCIDGRNLRKVTEGLRTQRVAYLRPLGNVLAKTSPASVTVITAIAVAKTSKADPMAESDNSSGEIVVEPGEPVGAEEA